MIRRLIAAAVLIPLVLVALFFFPTPLFLGFLSVFLLFSVHETLRLLSSCGTRPFNSTYVLTLGLPWLAAYRPDLLLHYLLATALVVLSWTVLRTSRVSDAPATAGGNLLAPLYLGLPFAVAAILHDGLELELLLVMVVVWAGDSGALFAGKSFGRHRIVPRISPGKTLEGYLGGLPASLLAALSFGHLLLPEKSLWFLAGAGLLIGVTAALGDLFESLLKRGAGVKDSSGLIPGHGGVLDRVDSILFALPAYYLLRHLVE